MPLPYCYEHPRPAVTVDIVACAFDGTDMRVLLVQRGAEPYKGNWALPGGFMEINERLHDAALRELEEETGLELAQELHLLGIYDAVKRDPRGRVLSVAFGALLRWPVQVRGGDDAHEVAWVTVKKIDGLAFDHREIVENGLRWVGFSVLAGDGAVALLPVPYTRVQAGKLYRAFEFPEEGYATWLTRMDIRRLALSSAKPKSASKSRKAKRKGHDGAKEVG